jgi:hypothetical protein
MAKNIKSLNMDYFSSLVKDSTEIDTDESISDRFKMAKSLNIAVHIRKQSKDKSFSSRILQDAGYDEGTIDEIISSFDPTQITKPLPQKFYILLDLYVFASVIKGDPTNYNDFIELVPEKGYFIELVKGKDQSEEIVNIKRPRKRLEDREHTLQVLNALILYHSLNVSNKDPPDVSERKGIVVRIAKKLFNANENITRYPNDYYRQLPGLKVLQTDISSNSFLMGITFKFLLITRYTRDKKVIFDNPDDVNPHFVSLTEFFDNFTAPAKKEKNLTMAERLFVFAHPLLYKECADPENVNVVTKYMLGLIDTNIKSIKESLIKTTIISSQWFMILNEIALKYQDLFTKLQRNPEKIKSGVFEDELQVILREEIKILNTYLRRGIMEKLIPDKGAYYSHEDDIVSVVRLFQLASDNILSFEAFRNYQDSNLADGIIARVDYTDFSSKGTVNFIPRAEVNKDDVFLNRRDSTGTLRSTKAPITRNIKSANLSFFIRRIVNVFIEFMLRGDEYFGPINKKGEPIGKTFVGELASSSWPELSRNSGDDQYDRAIFFHLEKETGGLLGRTTVYERLYYIFVRKDNSSGINTYSVEYSAIIATGNTGEDIVSPAYIKSLISSFLTGAEKSKLSISNENVNLNKHLTGSIREIEKDAFPLIIFLLWRTHALYKGVNQVFFDTIAPYFMQKATTVELLRGRYIRDPD